MSIRTVDPKCRECGRPLVDDLSRRRRVGPDCWARMTPTEQQHALELAARERDPHYIPPERAPSVQARVNHHNVQAVMENPAAKLCRHEQLAGGGCPDCRREDDPHRAAELILRSVLEQTFEARRAERAEILRRRYENGPPPIGARPLKRRRPAQPAAAKPAAPEPVAVQLELT